MFKRLAVALSLLSACTGVSPAGEGPGVAGEDARAVTGFDRVALAGSFAVEVEVGPKHGVRIEADDDVAALISTEVSGTTLEVSARGDLQRSRPVKVWVTTPTLVGVDHSGSGSLHARGISGDSFTAALSGSGSVRLAGKVDALVASLDGSGSLVATDLTARSVTVALSGSGGAQVHASERVAATLSGSGSVRYAGGAKDVARTVSGSGRVEPM